MKKTLEIILLASILLGCEKKKTNHKLQTVQIIAEKSLNHNSSIKLDLVQTFDSSIWNSLKKMKSEEYFLTKEEIINSNINGIKIWSFEPIPNKWSKAFCLQENKKKCYGSIIFIDYPSKNNNNVVIPAKYENIILKLGAQSLTSLSYNKSQPTDIQLRYPEKREQSS